MKTFIFAFLIKYKGVVKFLFLCVLQETSHSQQEQLEQIPELKGCDSFLVSIK